MNLLLSTATQNVVIVVFDDDYKIIKSYNYIGHNDHVVTVFQKLEEIKEYLPKLEKIYLNIGPGSFTGLRIGAVIAKTLAKEEIEIYTYTTIELLEASLQKPVAIDIKGKKLAVETEKGLRKIDNEEKGNNYLIDPNFKLENFAKTMEILTKKVKKNDEAKVIYAHEIPEI